MRVFRQLSNLPAFTRAVITIGTFDGVHKGHVRLIQNINDIARDTGGESIIITFHPHPRTVINPNDKTLRLLNTTDEKIELLRNHGVQNVVVVPFNRDFSEMGADDYIEKFLVENFKPAHIVIGYDHRFGKNRSGDIHLLQQYQKKYGFALVEIQQEMLHDITISSTKIRQALLGGQVQLAHQLLGYRYTFSGTVVRGRQLGRTLGFPTANLQINDPYKLVPCPGIYAVRVKRYVPHENEGKYYTGMMSIGNNPTFGDNAQTIEVNILDFTDDIYGEQLTVELLAYLRPEKKFNNADELIAAMREDERKTRAIAAQEGFV
ncbi:MAG: bifunctional riboflavin kinase/FAD synthetase [Chitinophagales bacterium]|nr:bifunctional riboflavin kinase/FAD synthetase [Chitinophagales bacterium]MDW8419398.1 bifunctional riboflavin kinase/FAD synthetase [Chitinophagales bacterium]